MNRERVSIILATITLAFFLFSGCSGIEYDSEKDRNTVIATVNGQPLYKGDLNDRWAAVEPMMEAAFEDMTDAEEKKTTKEYKANLVDAMVKQEVLSQMGTDETYHIELTDADLSAIEAQYQDTLNEITAFILENYQQSGITDVSEAQMNAEVAAFFEGQGTTPDAFYDNIKEMKKRAKLKDAVIENVTDVTKAEVSAYYDSMLQEQMTT